MDLLIISGLSGAGKSRVADILEDMNFYCVDNMPVELMPLFADFCIATKGRYERVALVTDVRNLDGFDNLFAALEQMKNIGCDYKILYVEASVDTIVKRYKETRRKHPLDPDGGNLNDSIIKEAELLKPIKDKADYIIDTSNMTLSRLQKRLSTIFTYSDAKFRFNVNIMSFGYKYGIPIDADIVLDVRFLLNPYYVPELRDHNGTEPEVSDYVFTDPRSAEYVKKVTDLLAFLLPNYIEEGKTSIVICIGCTGGKHRSVAITEALGREIAKLDYPVDCFHRDIDR